MIKAGSSGTARGCYFCALLRLGLLKFRLTSLPLKRWLWQGIGGFVLFSLLWVLVLRWLPPPATLTMLSRRISGFGPDSLHQPIRYRFVSLDEVSPAVPLALIAAEDQNFLTHNGFDFDAMYKAAQRNRKGKKLVGGSTISQQVAKNVFLWQGRSYVRKIAEAYFTFLIELFWGKARIMEVYCNVAETGPGLFGVEAAAQKYFKTSASKLTRQQAALIASVLPSPNRYSVRRPDSKIRRKATRVQRSMRHLGGDKYVEPLR
jgi:monofunctional glycosyltransferase